MTDQFDKAQELEQRFRDSAIDAHRNRVTEKPDEEDGIRYCLGCGREIPPQRIEASPDAVRCVPCQSKKEC